MEGQMIEGIDLLSYAGQQDGHDGTLFADVAMDNHDDEDDRVLDYESSADHNDDQQIEIGSLDPSFLDHDTMSEAASSQDFYFEEEEEAQEPLSYELQIGYRILKEIMSDSNKSVNWPFIDPVEADKMDLWDYYERIQKPMWLKKIEENFHKREYKTITEFVSDVRLMLENCYRYNGPDHYISKRGQKLEMILEQKLALLSRELREKTSIAATSGKPIEEKVISGTRRRKVLVPHDSTALLNQLRLEEKEREKEQRRQQMVEKQKEREAYLAELQEWEDSLYPTPWKKYMNAMWEVPQIGHFLFLCSLQLNIGEVVHWELERGFLLPRESSTFQTVMTSLISTPYQRTRLDKKPLMPYKVWEDRVRIRVRQWYKVLNDFKGDQHRAAYKLGIQEMFFKTVGLVNPLEKKKFHELTLYQRIWIVKSLCDWCLENQESIREAIEANVLEDQRTYSLGCDAEGFEYIHFPQFCGADLRIYKQAPIKMPKLELPPPESNKKPKLRGPKKPARKRDSRLRQNPRLARGAANNDSSDDNSNASDDSGISGSESEEDPEPKVPHYSRAAVTRNKLLDVDSDVSREGTPTRVTRSRTGTASNTPSRESTPQRSRRRRGEVSNTPEPSLYQRRSLRRLGIDASEIASMYFPEATPEHSGSKSPLQTVDDEDDKESTASDIKRPATRPAQNRKRKSRSRTRSKKSTRKKTKNDSDNEEARDEEPEQEKPFSSYMANSDNISEEHNEAKSGLPSGKISPSNCDTKSVHSECPSEPVTFVDSECSNSVRSTPVNEMLNNTETDKEKSAIMDNHVSKISEQAEEQHSQSGIDDSRKDCSPKNSVTSTTESKDHDLRESKCDESMNCDDGNTEAETQIDFSASANDAAVKENNIETKLVKSGPSNGLRTEAGTPEPGAIGDGPSVKNEEVKTELSEGSGGREVKSENTVEKFEDGTASVKTEQETEGNAQSPEIKEDSDDSKVKPENGFVETEMEPEIKEPILGEFELIVESVEDLRNLVLLFAPPEPVTEVKGTREKVIKPIPRKKCEVDLHKRLAYLLEELEPWEQKLIAANKRARLKMRREHANYKDDLQPEENLWESEESNSEDSNSEDEEVGDKKDVEKEKDKKKQPSSVTNSMAGDSKPPTPDLEVSSRGRIRKRRVIPDAAEDEGSDNGSPINQSRNAKRRKRDDASPVPTTSQETSAASGVPSHSTIQSVINQLAATNQLPSNGISVLNINNQMVLVSPGQKPVIIQTSQPLNNLSMSNLNLLAQLTGLVKPAPVTAASVNSQTATSGVAGVSQSPVRAQATANILRQASPRPAGSQSLISGIKPGQLTAQQVLMMKKQQLQKQQASKVEMKVTPSGSNTSIVTVVPAGTPKSVVSNPAGTSGIVTASAAGNSAKPQYVAYNNLHQMAPEVVKQLIQAQMKGGTVKTATVLPAQNVNSASKVVQVVRAAHAPAGNNAMMSSSGSITVSSTSTPQSSGPQGQVFTKLISPQAGKTGLSVTTAQPLAQKQPVSVSQLSNNNTLKQANPGLIRALSSPPKPKYAGNVTVKSLLESRAAQQKVDISSSLTSTTSLSNSAQILDGTTGLTSEAEAQVASAIAMDPERQKRLDEAIKTVLTEIQTSLPTATLKVTSPFMVSGVKNNRSVTTATSAMKSPIPALPQITSQSSASGMKASDASGAGASAAAGGSGAASVVMKTVQGQGGGQKLVLPVQLKPPGQASLTPRNLTNEILATDVGNVQAVVSNTALLQRQLNVSKSGVATGVSAESTAEPTSSVVQSATAVTPSATAKLQQAASQVVTSPPKAALKIHSISVQGSSATLQLTGVHGVAPGKAVQLKLTIPPGLTIHQLLQSPQLQQHLANLQSSGLSAATKSVAVQRTVPQSSPVIPQALSQRTGVQQSAAVSPAKQVIQQQAGSQVKTQASAAGIGSQQLVQEKTVAQVPTKAAAKAQVISSQGNVRGIVLQKGPVRSAQASLPPSGGTRTGLPSGVSPSAVVQMKPQNVAKLATDKIVTQATTATLQQSGKKPQVVKTAPQMAQKVVMQVGSKQQDFQGTVSAQQMIAQSMSGVQSAMPVQNVSQGVVQSKTVKQVVQKSPATIKQITQGQVPKVISQSPQKSQVGPSTKSQTVQQLLEAAQRRAASQNQGAPAQTAATVSSSPSQGIKIAPSAPVQQAVTQVAPKTVVTSPQENLTSPTKLVLVNMNGQLMTTSGVPVTVSQGMLKVMPSAQSVAAPSDVVQLPTQQMVALTTPQPQQQILMLPQQTLTSPVKVANQATTASLTAQQLLAVQQAQVQQQLKQAQVQAGQVQANSVQAQLQQVQVQPAQLQQKNSLPSTVQSTSPVSGINIGPGVAGTLVQTTQAQSTITLPASAISQSPGVAHIRMPVGTVIVPPTQTSRPINNPTNLTAVRLADGRYVLQVPGGASGTSKLVLPSSSMPSHLPNGDSS